MRKRARIIYNPTSGKELFKRTFFFSSRRRHTRCPRDWSSDVCSSDLEEKDLLEVLVSPVPEIFRDAARQSIASKIGELALERNVDKITRELLIEGYIIGTPKRDHRFLRRKLKQENIDVTPYEKFFLMSKDDYAKDWKSNYSNE